MPKAKTLTGTKPPASEAPWRAYQRSRLPEERVNRRVARWAGQQAEKAKTKPGISGKINYLLADQAAADARRTSHLTYRETKQGIRERKVAAMEARLGRKKF